MECDGVEKLDEGHPVEFIPSIMVNIPRHHVSVLIVRQKTINGPIGIFKCFSFRMLEAHRLKNS
jgi:hypothetical protein